MGSGPITDLEVGPTFSMVQAAEILGRSRSWADLRVRSGQLTLISTPCYRKRWVSMEALQQAPTQPVAARGAS